MLSKQRSFLLISCFLLLLNYNGFAQRLELTATGGYQYWGSYKYYNNVTNSNGKISLGGGPCYGGILGYELKKSTFVELVYNHQDSRVIDKPNFGTNRTLGNVGVNYFQLNVTRGISVNDKVEPYTTIGIGGVFFDPTSSKVPTLWKFAANLGVGVKYFVSDKIGLRFGVGFWAPIQGAGIGVGFGTGGAYVGASTYTTVVQMNASGGIIFRLKN
jgi:opacity protein-like surface antigen